MVAAFSKRHITHALIYLSRAYRRHTANSGTHARRDGIQIYNYISTNSCQILRGSEGQICSGSDGTHMPFFYTKLTSRAQALKILWGGFPSIFQLSPEGAFKCGPRESGARTIQSSQLPPLLVWLSTARDAPQLMKMEITLGPLAAEWLMTPQNLPTPSRPCSSQTIAGLTGTCFCSSALHFIGRIV